MVGCRHIYFVGNPVQKEIQLITDFQVIVTQLKIRINFTYSSSIFSETPMLKIMAIKQLLSEHKADGIVCTDDLTAQQSFKQHKNLVFNIPEQLKITGFDGTKFIQQYHPELSTVVQPTKDIVALLVKLLERRIAHPDEILKQSYIYLLDSLKSKTISDN